MIRVVWMPRDEANAAISRWHRHHDPVRSHRYAAGAFGPELLGVVIVGSAPESAELERMGRAA